MSAVLKQELIILEAKLKQELAEFKAELDKLREQMLSGMQTVHKDLSLISLVPKWSGAENATPLEFLASVDRAALIGRWQDADCFNIVVLRLADPAKAFYITHVQSSTLKTRHGRSSRTCARKI